MAKSPSKLAEQRRQQVSKEFDTGGASHSLLTKRNWSDYNGLEKLVNKIGEEENHWNSKFNGSPYSEGKGWQNYLMDKNVDGKNETAADKEVDFRISSVLYVWAKATIQYYHDKSTTLVDNVQKKEVGDDLKEYMTNHQGDSEKSVYGDDQIKNLIKKIEAEAKKDGSPSSPPHPVGGGWENVGMGQRYYGNTDLESVGFCMRYLKTK